MPIGPADPNAPRDTLARTGHHFHNLELGPYVVDGIDPLSAAHDITDLGATFVGIIRQLTVSITDLDFDGDDGTFRIRLDVSFDGVNFYGGGENAEPDRPRVVVGEEPGSFTATGEAAVGPLLVPRYIRARHLWAGGDIGANATATFAVLLDIA